MNITEEEYKKCRNKVKLWERDFRKRENRPPSKDDIKQATSSVREAYKLYWLAKTSILEEAILDDEIPDAKLPPPVEKSEVKIAIPDTTSKADSPVKLPNMNTVWGDHLKKVVEKTKEVKLQKSSSFEFTQKLFKGINMKKKVSRKFAAAKHSKLPHTVSLPEECSQNSLSDITETIPLPEKKEDLVDNEFNFDLVKIVEGKTSISAQPVSILQASDNANPLRFGFKSKLNEGWLERCQQKCAQEASAVTAKERNVNNQIKSISVSVKETPQNENNDPKPSQLNSVTQNDARLNSEISSGDDYVYSSDDETVGKLKNASALKGHVISETKSSEKRAGESLPRPRKKPKTQMTTEEVQEQKLQRLHEKLNSGTANDNFVKVDIKRKRYSRGKNTISSAKYKVQQWKAKKKLANSNTDFSNGGGLILKCFRCGDVGHFMRQCKKGDTLLPLVEELEEDDSPFPTLEEAAAMVKEKVENESKAELQSILESAEPDPEDDMLKTVTPLYECQKDGALIDTPDEVFEALNKFGYENFRAGQERAVMRILSGKSTLVIAGTGSGKSLCYQLPAYLYAKRYNCMSLVISPLVSLMEDQVLNFPSFLKAACLHNNQTAQAREKILKRLEKNEITVLLVSPEAMVSGERGILGQVLVKNCPSIAFVCIDEVHCVSQWSHNFRTAYLMICKILREKFNIRTFLGLTATASKSSIISITGHLGIEDNDTDGVVQDSILPDNLVLSVSKDESKDNALLSLLKESPFSEFDSIIIYCLRRNECERIASFLRTALQNFKKKLPMFGERCSVSSQVEVYHAGVSASRRKKVQNHFMQGKLRIVVATVAFGMGINKSDIRGIIHYNMPRTFEHYVQEIGRAGRDGLAARCHLFYDREGNDIPELKRQIHSDSLDRPTIRELLYRVFPRCSCKDTCRKHEIAFSVEETVRNLDLGQENISTLLCYLELLPEKILEVQPITYTKCTLVSYNGFLALKRAARKCPPLAFAIAEHCKLMKTKTITSKLEFPVIELADRIGWDSGVVKRELKRCEWIQIDDKWKKTGIGVSFQDVGFHVRSPGNLSDEQLDNALEALYNRVSLQEEAALHQLKICDLAFGSVAYDNIHEANECENLHERDEKLKKVIYSYFMEENKSISQCQVDHEVIDEQSVITNIHRLVSRYRDSTFTALAIARIFHGIESPNFPAIMWGRTPFWRSALKEDFNALYRLACRELIKFR